MATSITGLSEAQIDDTMVMALASVVPMMSAFSTFIDFEGDLPAQGDTRTVPVVGKITIGDKTAGDLPATSGSVTGAPVVLDKFLAGSFEAIEGKMSRSVFAAWWQRQVPYAAHELAVKIVNNALALVKNANYASKTEVNPAALAVGDLATIRGAAKKHIPGTRAMLLAGPDLASRITVLEPVVNVYGIVDKANVVANDGLPSRLIGYKAFEYDELPDNGEKLLGAIIDPAALAVAASAPSQLTESGQGDIVYRRLITEPESGLTVQYTEIVRGGGRIIGEVACLSGAKVVDKTACHRIVSSVA